MARIHTAALIGLALLVVSCGRTVDLSTALQAEEVTTGWFDAGIVNGNNKLVPSISFRLRNTSPQDLRLQINAVYKILPEGEDRDDSFLQNIHVPANGTSDPMTIRADSGFTSEVPRAEMLQHSLFRDFEVRLFVKHGAGSWVPLGEYRVERQLLTR
jgi:hypothetical protein